MSRPRSTALDSFGVDFSQFNTNQSDPESIFNEETTSLMINNDGTLSQREEKKFSRAMAITSYIIFLFFGISTTIVWYAVTTSISDLFALFGSEIFLLLLLTHNVPAAPVIVLQTLYD